MGSSLPLRRLVDKTARRRFFINLNDFVLLY